MFLYRFVSTSGNIREPLITFLVATIRKQIDTNKVKLFSLPSRGFNWLFSEEMVIM